jgi:hypothetical protein
MGTDENSVIQIKEDLTKKAGDRIHLALIAELTGAGVTGDTLLEGAEEALSQYEFPITVSTLRNGVAVTLNNEQFTGIDIRNAGKTMLQNWAMKKLRTDIITQLSAIFVSGTGNVAYGFGVGSQQGHLARGQQRPRDVRRRHGGRALPTTRPTLPSSRPR